MKALTFYIVIFILVGCENTPRKNLDIVKENYSIVFEDEFQEQILDTLKWKTNPSFPAPYNKILPRANCDYENAAVLNNSNIIIQGGILKLIAKKEDIIYKGIGGGDLNQDLGCGLKAGKPFEFSQKYSTASLFGKTGFSNGIFECRAKIPSAKGLYPVFWLWHHDEIVVFEFFGNKKKHFVSAHNKEKYVTKEFERLDYSKAFHTYAVHWTNDYITWYFDDQEIWSICRDETNAPCPSALNSKADNDNFNASESFPDSTNRWLKPNISLRIYEWAKYVDDEKLPDTLKIDYVRLYQKNQE